MFEGENFPLQSKIFGPVYMGKSDDLGEAYHYSYFHVFIKFYYTLDFDDFFFCFYYYFYR